MMPESIECGICKRKSKVVKGVAIYPNSSEEVKEKLFHYCPRCRTQVGIGDDGRALGKMANEDTRVARQEAYHHFSRLWAERGSVFYLKRDKAYRWLSDVTGIHYKEIRIGEMDEEQCWKVIEASIHRAECSDQD